MFCPKIKPVLHQFVQMFSWGGGHSSPNMSLYPVNTALYPVYYPMYYQPTLQHSFCTCYLSQPNYQPYQQFEETTENQPHKSQLPRSLNDNDESVKETNFVSPELVAIFAQGKINRTKLIISL